MPFQKGHKWRFKPGQSGNPSGRPKEALEIRDLAESYSQEAIEVLRSIMYNKKSPSAARVAAANALLDRGLGKPVQTVDATNTNVNYAVSDQPMTDEEWADEHVTEH